VVSNFILQALQNKPLTIYGDGTQSRSFCYVDDMIDGFLRLMHSSDDFAGPVNFGNPVEFTMLELAEQIRGLTNSKSEIKYEPLPEDDPKQRQPDITLAKDKLGWEPRVPLQEGLEKTIDYFSDLLKSGVVNDEN
jgi:UDP-glucuronate decarboxylase